MVGVHNAGTGYCNGRFFGEGDCSVFIKHRQMRDVCLKAIEFEEKPSHIRVKGVWVNIAHGSPFFMGTGRGLAIEEFRIARDKFEAEWFRKKECFDYVRS